MDKSADKKRKAHLAGRRIVVTRAPEQSEELARRLRQSGAEVLFLPTVRFLDPESTADLDRAVRSLEEFDWIVFTSANAARFFLKRCAQLGCALGRDAKLKNAVGSRAGARREAVIKIAAVGPATRAAVEAEGLRVSFVPGESSGRALADALAPEVRGKRVLLPRSDLAKGELSEALRATGALVTEAVAYRTSEPESFDAAVRAALVAGEVDAVTFFSPSAFHYFARALGERELREVAGRAAFAAVGPVTASAIRGAGFAVAVEAAEASSASLAATLEEYCAARSASGRGSGEAAGGAMRVRPSGEAVKMSGTRGRS